MKAKNPTIWQPPPGWQAPVNWEPITPSAEIVSDDVRRVNLSAAVAREVQAGGRVLSQDDFGALIRHESSLGAAMSVLFLILTVITGGLWGIVWLVVWLASSSQETVTLNVDACGNVIRRKVASA